MSPEAFIGNSKPDPTPRDDLEYCPDCDSYAWRGKGHHCTPPTQTHMRRSTILALVIIAALMLAGLLTVHSAQARQTNEGMIQSFDHAPRPIAAPAALVKERGECRAARSVETCLRGKLRSAYASVTWQRHERLHQGSFGVGHAIRLASALYGVPVSELRRVGTCESHLHARSKNRSSTASGLFQFLDSTWARAGVPGFSVFDPYANAIAAARLVKSDGSWREWSCQP